jgi:HlyD family secretion protein
MKKFSIFAGILVVVIAAIAAWRASQPDAVVTLIQPQVQTIRAYVEEQAVTELPTDHLVAMPISGRLEPIDLREGDPVEEGQTVARFDTEDLQDRLQQAENQIAVHETKIQQTADNRLEENMLVQMEAMVKAINETVQAAEAKQKASDAVAEFAETELNRILKNRETGAASDREIREAETNFRQTRAQNQSDALELAALKTVAAVSYIGPKFVTDTIDRKSFDLESTRNQLEEAKAELEIRKRDLSRAEIKSPITGVVLQRHQTRRQFLQAGTALLTIGRLEDLEIVADVLTQRATRILPDNPVEIFGEAITDEPLTGKVSRIYPAGFKKISSLGVEQQRVKVAIKLDQRPPRLGVAFRVQVRIFHDQADNALTLPRTAIFRTDAGGWAVMKVQNNITQQSPVEIGLMNDDTVQVLNGLSAKDWLVAHPSREITADMHVEPAKPVDQP